MESPCGDVRIGILTMSPASIMQTCALRVDIRLINTKVNEDLFELKQVNDYLYLV